MADGSPVHAGSDPVTVEIDRTIAHPSRMYDYLLGGTVNFAVDREAVDQASATVGGIDNARAAVRANRTFLVRAVRYLATVRGMRQFLDIGTGIPNADNVHAVAQQAAPESRVVYVDHDPIVLAHAHELLVSTPQGATTYIHGDLRQPEAILQQAAPPLDLGQPVVVMLVSMLHFFADEEDPYGIVARLMAGVPSGSYLVVSHLAGDINPEEMAALAQRYRDDPNLGERFVMRTRDEVGRFLAGLELVPPGVVPVDHWHPDDGQVDEGRAPAPGERLHAFHGAVGRKP